MLSRLYRHVTFANVVSLLALFVALSGGAYALTIPRNSVGAKQLKANAVRTAKIKNGAVTSRKVRNRSLLAADFKRGQLPAGPPGPFPSGLPSGRTLTGAYAASGVAAAGGETVRDGQSFAFPLATEPTPHVIPVAGPATPECPGTVNAPSAAAGHLCVYEGANANASLVVDAPAAVRSERFGWIAQITSIAGGAYQSRGTWAVTAPV